MARKYKCKLCDAGPFGMAELIKHKNENHGGFKKPKKATLFTKRKYTKRAVVAPQPVNFCPGCGCNLKAIQIAMTL